MYISCMRTVRAFKITLLILVCSNVVSCNQGSASRKRTQFARIEAALRNLLVTQRASIEQDAPFVCENDTFAGGVNVLGKENGVIGKWTVEIAESHAHATTQRRFCEGQRFESEVVEVDLEIDEHSVKVSHWRAYKGWGTQTGGAVASPSSAEEESPGRKTGRTPPPGAHSSTATD